MFFIFVLVKLAKIKSDYMERLMKLFYTERIWRTLKAVLEYFAYLKIYNLENRLPIREYP